jgi:hypothetical protein
MCWELGDAVPVPGSTFARLELGDKRESRGLGWTLCFRFEDMGSRMQRVLPASGEEGCEELPWPAANMLE